MPQAAALSMGPKLDSPDVIGSELRAALPGVRLHSLSLHDADGDVLWLSEGVLGPDEHGVVIDAMTGQGSDAVLVDRPLGDGRNALVLPARSAGGEIVGAAMLIVDTKHISGELLRKLAGPSVTVAMAKLVARQEPVGHVQRPPAAVVPATVVPPARVPSSAAPPVRRPVPAPAPVPVPAPAAAPLELELAPHEPRRLPPAPPTRAPKPVPLPVSPASGRAPRPNPGRHGHHSVARSSLKPPPKSPAPPPARRKTEAERPRFDPESTLIAPKPEMHDLTLVVQQLLKLRSGGRTRRYEVLLRSRSNPSREAAPATLMQAVTARDATSGIDRYVLSELVSWLGQHREVWEVEPSSFTVNLSPTTLSDRSFLQFAASVFDEWQVTPGVVGFEIPERACVDAPTEIRHFIEQCEKLGFFLALDDFSMHSTAVPFLASPAVRLVKIDARLTLAAMKDKLSQAMVIAISQAAKVLGVHCVAKRIESTMARQWLSGIGIDFAQGFALERPQTLEALLASSARSTATEPV
jgi:EAL domain-containing protein (putative c-di-GMP-specific phosphodiesterase class I)